MRTTPQHLAAEYRASGAWSEQRIGDLFASSAAVEPARCDSRPPQSRRARRRRAAASRLAIAVRTRRCTMVALADAGLRTRRRADHQLPNVVEYVAVYLACAARRRRESRADAVPSRRDRAAVQAHARAQCSPVSRSRARARALARPSRRAEVLVLGQDAAGTRAFVPEPSPTGAARVDELERAANVNADDIVTICWTSGTEGVPKGVPRSHNHWISGSLCHYDGAQIRRGDRLLNPFPLVNMAALGGCFMSWLRAAGHADPAPPVRVAGVSAADRDGEPSMRSRRRRS